MITSKLYSANTRDFIQSFFAAIAGAVWAVVAPNVMTVITSQGKTGFIINFTQIWQYAAGTGLLFLAHRFIQPQKSITTVQK